MTLLLQMLKLAKVPNHPNHKDPSMTNQKEKKPDFYMTGGKKMGRLLKCKEPFVQGDGIFYFSTNDADWEQVKGAPLTQEEMHYYIEEIRKMRVNHLKEVVKKYQHKGYFLQENDYGALRLMKKIAK